MASDTVLFHKELWGSLGYLERRTALRLTGVAKLQGRKVSSYSEKTTSGSTRHSQSEPRSPDPPTRCCTMGTMVRFSSPS
jgi:hypothetical protein